MEENKKNEKKENLPWWHPGILLFVQLSGWIAVPIIISIYLGRWLDQKYNTKPWLFLVTVIMAFAVSMFGIVREACRAITEFEKFNKKKSASAKVKADKVKIYKDDGE